MGGKVPSQEEIERLVREAQDVDLSTNYRLKPLAQGLIWRAIDATGRVAIPVALVSAILGFLLTSIGPDWVWASLFYLITIIVSLNSKARRSRTVRRVARPLTSKSRAWVA